MSEKNLLQNNLTGKITGFLTKIGIEVSGSGIRQETFLPGILVEKGKILFDESKLVFPGDLLHEAGHLAVAPAAVRAELGDEIIVPNVILNLLEAQAILWSYAACIYLEIDPRIVFHEAGYKGKSQNILFNFHYGIYFGLNGLEEYGMAFSENKAKELGVSPFPKMQKWLRD
jgi:hypothetical protein